MQLRVSFKKTLQARPYEPVTLEAELSDIELDQDIDSEEIKEALAGIYSDLEEAVTLCLENSLSQEEPPRRPDSLSFSDYT